jgi:hypothetical protein
VKWIAVAVISVSILIACVNPRLTTWAHETIGSPIRVIQEIDLQEGTRGRWYKLDSGNRVYVTMVFTCEVHFEVNAEDIIVAYQLVGRDCSRM